MIHLTSSDMGDVTVRLTDHDETVMISSESSHVDIFLTGAQAFVLYEQLRETLKVIKGTEDVGLLDEVVPIYARLREYQRSTT